MGTGLAVVNSNLPLSLLRGGEPAAEAGVVLYGWAPRPCRARRRGMGRVGAQGPPRACGGSSTCGARDRECVRLWGSRARATVRRGECCGAGRAHLRIGSTGCAVRGTRVGPLAGPNPNGTSEPAIVDGGHAPIQRGSVWACCHPGLL